MVRALVAGPSGDDRVAVSVALRPAPTPTVCALVEGGPGRAARSSCTARWRCPPAARRKAPAMRADRSPAALWVLGQPDGSHRYEERGLPADAAERVRCLFCASKPMVAMAVLSLLEHADVELERARIDAAGGLVADRGWPVADLLWHRSPLVGPTIWEALRFPLGTLEDELSRAAARAVVDGGRAGYSDVLAWHLLSQLAIALAGRSWVADLQAALRAQVGPALWLRPDRELLELPAEAQLTLLARHRGVEVPMVHALTRRTRALASPYLGAHGSFAAVVSWFQAFASHLQTGGGTGILFPSVAYLGRALERCGRPGQRHAASLEVRAPGPASAGLVGVQAAGGALSVWFEPVTARVVAVLGGTFLEDPAERRRWCAAQLAAAHAWAAAPGRPVGDGRPSRGPTATTWRGEVRSDGGERCRRRVTSSGSAGAVSGCRSASRPWPGRSGWPSSCWTVTIPASRWRSDRTGRSSRPTLDRDVVHDGALAAPVELVHAICTGALDAGHAVSAGALTGTMASQSVLAYLLEAVATVDFVALGRAAGDARGAVAGWSVRAGPAVAGALAVAVVVALVAVLVGSVVGPWPARTRAAEPPGIVLVSAVHGAASGQAAPLSSTGRRSRRAARPPRARPRRGVRP